MLLASLLAFGLLGLAAPYFPATRNSVILLLSAGVIGIISPASLLTCVLLASVNYFLLKRVYKRNAAAVAIMFNLLVLLGFHVYQLFYRKYEWAGIPALFGIAFLVLQFIDHFFLVRHAQRAAPQRFLTYLGAVLYLPKFFSGPVASLPFIQDQVGFNTQARAYQGLNRILLGLVKKLVFAEGLAISVHSVFDYADAYPGLTYLAAAMLYAVQLYFDFGGYSDIAIGASALWGISLPENFFLSFRQRSWAAFWKNWHASFTHWLWQYIFNPVYLALTRRKVNKTACYVLAALAVFSAMSFFNGVESGYYVSSACFLLFYCAERVLGLKPRAWRAPVIFILFSLALVFFRNPAFSEYSAICARLCGTGLFFPGDWLRGFAAPLAAGGAQHDYFNLIVTLTLVSLFLLSEKKINALLYKDTVNLAAWFLLIILLLTWGVFESSERFIYMQF